jgi:biopolymer transport protein ExbB/TolQ
MGWFARRFLAADMEAELLMTAWGLCVAVVAVVACGNINAYDTIISYSFRI